MKNLKFLKLFIPILFFGILASCSDDDDPPIEGCTCSTSTNYNADATIDDGSCIAPPPSLDIPTTYAFVRNCESTVSYSGQTTRLMQADELYSALNNASSTQENLDLMFAGEAGESAGFENPDLNGTSKIIGTKTSRSSNTATNLAIFTGWLSEFANEVAPELEFDPDGNKLDTAEPGIAGYLGGYELNAEGQEIDQLFFKGLIGAFALDQIINNYITPSQLDAVYTTDDNVTIDRRENNTNGVLYSDKNYTEMEHKWDEGFGYLYGQVADIESNFGLPADDEATGNLLMKYFKKVEENYQPGIAETVYNAFIAGRHAITIADYDARDAAATIIKTELSKVIGYYSKHYLNDYITQVSNNQIAKAHHSLSEGYGFMFSLQFTNDGNDTPYMDNFTVMYALNNYFDNFHTQQSIFITDPNLGMIAQIDNAFGW